MVDIENRMAPDSAVYRTLLESTRAIPWKIDWDSKQFAYIGPQIEALLGWTTAPEPWALHLEWTYAGDEQWRLGQPHASGGSRMGGEFLRGAVAGRRGP